MHTRLARIIATVFSAAATLGAMAVPAHPGKQTVSQPDGSLITLTLVGDETCHVTLDTLGREMRLDADGYWRPTGDNGADAMRRRMQARRTKRNADSWVTAFPRTGKVKSLVLLVEFPDVKFGDYEVNREFDEMLNLAGFDRREHIGCAADYFRIQSKGQFDPTFDVYGPVLADRPSTYYGENDDNGDDFRAPELAMELCRKLDSEIDFSDYDLDGDGKIDNVYFFYAGYGENFAGNKADWLWPHANHIDLLGIPEADRTYDGKVLNSYGCCAELYGSTGADITAIGTFCHEFGHILGLPDTYDVNYALDGSADHPDKWDIMASGSYLPATRNCGAVPAGYTALERWLLGWDEPVDITRPQTVALPDLQSTGTSVRISTADPDEFFLLENRQQTPGSYDRYIPSHGLLVWHVDRRGDATITATIEGTLKTITCAEAWDLANNALNANSTHMLLEIEKASGNDGSKSTLDTPFPGRQMKTEFTDYTTPSMTSWSGRPTGRPVTDIAESNGVVTFRFMGGGEAPVVISTLPATDVSRSGFTARWQLHPEATEGYRIRLFDVARETEENAVTIDKTFTQPADDWTADGAFEYREGAIVIGATGNATLASPSISIPDGGTLTIRARQGGATAGSLTVRLDDETIDQYIPTDQASNYTIDLPASETPRQIILTCDRRKPVAIERVTLRQDVEDVALYPLPNLTATVPADRDEHTFTEVEPLHEYAYTVEALGFAASAGAPEFVVTETGTGVSAVTGREAPDAAYRIDGLPAGNNATPGIYIIRRGDSTVKTIKH